MIGQIELVASRLLPEGSIKEFLRKRYRRRYNPFYPLVGLISRVELPGDGSVLLELTNGVKLYGPPDQVMRRVFQYADRSRLGEIGELGRWSTFLQIVGEEYVGDVYGGDGLTSGDTVLDLGAHSGAYTVKAALAVGATGRVIAIEPSSENFRLLNANVHLNGLRNVTLVQTGVWSRKARLRLHLSAMSGAHTFESQRSDAPYTGDAEDADVDTVDHIVRALPIGSVDVIKMDIEGAEIEALQGMTETLLANDARVAIAAYHRINGVPTHYRIRGQLKELGYRSVVRRGIVYAQKDHH